MLKISYSSAYLKIYLFQFISMLLGFISMFIVIPYLSSDQPSYGIYSVCISVNIFLSYADLGFLGAGMKFAAECYAKGDEKGEVEYVGFSHFILFIFVMLLAVVFLFFGFKPDLLIEGINSQSQLNIARRLLFVLSFFSPLVIFQRMLQMIFSVRLEDYVLQRIIILGNVIKLSSVYFFFGLGRYRIVDYFLFMQLVNVLIVVIGFFTAKKRYNYNFMLLLNNLKFNKRLFDNSKSLALSSLVATFSWVLYYEIDSFAIVRIFGANEVAIYTIGFTLLSFFRSLLGIYFAPFSARFNHFIGLDKHDDLKSFYLHIITLSIPVVIFPIIAILFFARPIIISWVGIKYEDAIVVARTLVVCNVLAFFSYPAGILMIACKKLKEMNLINLLLPIIYWIGVISTLTDFGIESFAIFKLVVFVIAGVFYIIFSVKYLNITPKELISLLIPYIPSFVFLCVGLYFLNDLFIKDKSILFLFMNISLVSLMITLAFAVCFFTVRPFSSYLIKMLVKVKCSNLNT